MMRLGPCRLCAVLALLVLSVFAIGVDSASASHFRYGSVSWEKVLTHNVAGETKFRVTFEGGWRWSFTWGGSTTNSCPAGFAATGPVGAGSCPVLGSTVSLGSITTTGPVKFNAASTFSAVALSYAGTVTSILQAQDQMFTSFTFEVTVRDSDSPITLAYEGSARVSDLRDGNANQFYRVAVTLSTDPALGTRSPRSVTLPTIPVTVGINNTVSLRSLGFDNFINKFRLSTLAESRLVVAQPLSPSVFSVDGDTGVVDFEPSAAGLYAVQFQIESYDQAGELKSAIPLDLTFLALAPAVGLPSAVLTGPSSVSYPIGQANSFQLQAALSPPTAGWTGTIAATPLPPVPSTGPGMATFTQTAGGDGLSTITGTVAWTPSLQSGSHVMCFQAHYKNASTGAFVTSPGMKCVNMLLGSFQTTISNVTVPGAPLYVGQRPSVSATLTRTIDGSPMVQRTVTFTVTDPAGVERTSSGLTNVSGVATAPITLPKVGNYTVRAAFTAVANEFAASTSSNGTFSVVKATGATFPSAPVATAPSLNYPTSLSVQMYVQPVNLPAPPGQVVEFVVTPAGGPETVVLGVTDAQGIATAQYTPQLAAPHTVFARFQGSDDVTGPATSVSSIFGPRQRVQLTMSIGAAIAGGPTPVSLTFRNMPQATPLASRSVALSFSGPNVVSAPSTLTTDANGAATTTAIFSGAGAFTATATTTLIGTEANQLGQVANESVVVNVPVTTASTSLSALTGIPATMLQNTPLTTSTTLTRTAAPVGPVGGATVTYTLTRLTAPVATLATQLVTTSVSGAAAITFPAAHFSVAGMYQISASYLGTAALDPATTTSSVGVSNVPIPTLSMSSIDAYVGVTKAVTATLMTSAVPPAPIAGASVTLSRPTGTLAIASTNAAGVATFSFTLPGETQTTATASFAGIPGVHGPATVTVPFSVSKSVTALTAPVTSPATAVIGIPLTAGTTLTRVTPPGSVATGSPVIFTMTDPFGSTQTPAAATTAGGGATVSLSPLARGAYTLKAEYAGSSAETSATSPLTTFNVYERTTLSLPAVSGVSGAPLAISATLRTSPANLPVAGQTVTFSFGGVIPAQTATTDAAGVATTTATFATAGTVPVTASFLNLPGFFVNSVGAQAATTATANATVTAVATTLAPITIPATTVLGAPITASTVLTRTSGGSAVNGATVTFTFAGPVTSTASAVTNAAGFASVTVPTSIKGAYTVTAAFAASPGLLASSTSTSTTVLQGTQLALAPVTGFAGSPTTISATLLAAGTGTPIAGQLIEFTSGGFGSMTAMTDSFGVASVSAVFPVSGNVAVEASFANAAAFYAGASASGTATIGTVVSALAPLTVADSSLVGAFLTVSSVLERTTAPAAVISGAPVTFTLTGPSGAVVSLAAPTDGNGFASVSFPLSVRGVHAVRADYFGTAGIAGSTSSSVNVTVYQRAQIVLSAAGGIAGQNVPVSATLTSLPGNQQLSGKTLTFDFAGVLPTQTATTGANGSAAVSGVFSAGGTFPATVSFTDAADFFTNAGGSIPPVPAVASGNVVITGAATALTAVSAPATGLVGDSISASTTLTRTSAPAGPVAGETVVFTLAGGPSPMTFTATTNGAGLAQVMIPLTAKGPFTLTASYAASTSLSAATSAPANVTAYQRVMLAFDPITSYAGASTTVSAQLTTVPDGVAVANQSVTFSTSVPGLGPITAVSAADGRATVSLTFPQAQTVSITATHVNAGGFFADSTGALLPATATEPAVIVMSTASALAPLTVPSSSLVGTGLTAATVLQRTTPSAAPMAGATVVFTLDGPVPATLMATTDVNGAASVSFPSMSTKGAYTVTAAYLGSGAVTGSTSNTATVTVYQPTQLALTSASSTAGEPASLSATLTALASGAPVAGQVVTFDVDGLPAETATTNASGVATVTVTAPASGTFAATASFQNPAAFFTNTAGAIPPVATTATSTVTVAKATTQLSLTAPTQALIGNTLTATATLTRNGSTPTAGQLVAVTLAGPSTVTLTATTDSTGAASVTFPLSQRGTYAVSAQFAGSPALDAAASAVVLGAIYQRTQLAIDAASGTAGSPLALSATLTSVPAGLPIAGQTVQFAIPSTGFSASAVTDATGVATVSSAFGTAGSFPAVATFVNGADFYVDANGVLVATTASATVVVSDSTPPVVSATVTGTLGLGGWYVGDVTVAWTVSDAQSDITAQNGCGPQTVSVDGTVTFTCEATSGGGTKTETVTVKRDITAPAITVPLTQTIEATSGDGALAAYPVANAVDPTSGLAAPLACTPAAGTQLALGNTTVSCTARDEAGNQGRETFTISVVDTTAPAIDAVANITTPATGPLGAAVNFAAPASLDLVDGAGLTVCTPAGGSTFALGTKTVSCEITDAHGNTGTRTFTVTVTNVAPTVTVPAAPISTPATGPNGAPVTFTVTASDLEDITLTPVCSPASGSTFELGSTTVSCVATDTAGATDTETFTVTVTNNAPTFTPPANIVMPASGPMSAVVTFTAAGSDLEQGTIPAVCTPASGSTFPLGTTTVACTVTDRAGASASGSFTVTVTNAAPVAVNDTYTGQWNTPLTIAAAGVLANDTDANLNALTATVVTQPASGTLVLNANGSFTYTPGPNFSGADSFTYRASDGLLTSVAATVRLTVTSPCTNFRDWMDRFRRHNDRDRRGDYDHDDDDDEEGYRYGFLCRPGTAVARNDYYLANQNKPLQVPARGVLKNDGFFAATAVVVTPPLHGTVTLAADGSFIYVPAPNYYGIDSFVYVARNPSNVAGPVANVRLAVRPNLAPDADNDKYSVKRNTTLTVPVASSVLKNDSDPNDDTLSATLVSGPSRGTLTLNANGSFTYKPNNNFTGTDYFTYKALDPGGKFGTATVRLVVSNGNSHDDDDDHNDGDHSHQHKPDHDGRRNGHFSGDGCREDRRD